MKLSRGLLAAAMMLLLQSASIMPAAGPAMTVYKTSTCGCCGKWVEHLKAAGFQVTVKDVPSTGEYQIKFGVPAGLQSCHTGIVDGYTVEGHVPAADIHRLLKERPKAKGLAVPGMPMGSPGMEGETSDAYSVLLFQADGKTSVFQRYQGK